MSPVWVEKRGAPGLDTGGAGLGCPLSASSGKGHQVKDFKLEPSLYVQYEGEYVRKDGRILFNSLLAYSVWVSICTLSLVTSVQDGLCIGSPPSHNSGTKTGALTQNLQAAEDSSEA